jgi:acetate kinase
MDGKIDRIGLPGARFSSRRFPSIKEETRSVEARDYRSAARILIDSLEQQTADASLKGIGHRIVHGGPSYIDPQKVTPEMLDELRKISAYDPEHMPFEIDLMEMFAQRFPNVPQIACFDTAFHNHMPAVAQILPIPREYRTKGIRRYGFHGLSYGFLMEELRRVAGPEIDEQCIILAHLGNGASLAAVRNGNSIDTSMGFTPAAGLPMSTRSGDLDPGLVFYLEQTEKMDTRTFNHMVNHQSGLLGVSDISPDVRDLLARQSEDIRAAEAIELFCYQTRKWIGAFAAALGGLQTLVFSAGIGENSPEIRARICDRLGILGIRLEPAKNQKNADVISASDSAVTVRVIHTDEEIMIAKAVSSILKS